MRIALFVLSLLFLRPCPISAQARVDRNVVYGMFSGLALLMDVHVPEKPNGRGVVFVAGNAWQSPLTYGAEQLKDDEIPDWGPPLLAAGYTVFAINHRAAPRFHYPAPVEDVQRAVRFVRHNASRYGIDPERLGGVGGSSGAHLVGLVATLAASGATADADPVNRQPATFQAVVLRAGPMDLRKMIGGSTIGTAAVVGLLDRLPTPQADDQRVYREASPIGHVSATSPPTLLIHGDADDTVPLQQSVDMEAALRTAQVPTKLVRIAGGAHGPDFGNGRTPHPQFPEALREVVAWLDQYLKAR